ncbi:complex I subunit 5 family protein [Caldisalinibacter kiritimatiensis]|uniref:NADH/Ubiquinone/plastoquinone (Complex I) n=1 Tax=Caldisalinibacter kiritimatiensis TaxID=1304284 RepID=R1CHV7_9FIRM|nr:proton-conducting transporter membrane subunit [Caldisalinibacter kiritimatiensis]EOD01870.1 NADH/Ubiquinone/plastoquinone (complex I) [Caldisalinibacter kiritimatiensis]
MKFIPIYLIFIPIVTAMFVYVLHKRYFNYIIFLSQLMITYFSIKYYMFYNGFINRHVLVLGGWNEIISITLRNDQLSISFIFLSIFIWWSVIIYSWEKRKTDFKFLFFLLFLEGTFLGFIQTNDIFNMFVLIEITTIISTILIIYKKDGYSVRAGLYYLLFNSVGMIFYLIGLIFIYVVTGTLNMDIISEKINYLGENSVVILSYIFIMAAIGVKSAFFPVYNWLPKAHGAAPASISALLSGLLVKSGVYAFIRFNQVYNINLLYDLFFILGFITAISGIIFALSQKDIKQILAFHTISQIGIILMGISSMSGKAYMGGIMHIFNHSMFKSLLFMGAGYIINVYGTRRVTEIRGVFKNMPLVSIFMIIGMLSITGAPFFNGFVSKTVIKYGLKPNTIKTIMLYIINLGTSISFIKMSQIFFGEFKVQKIRSYNNEVAMLILSMMCIILGNFYIPLTKGFFGVDFSFVKVVSLMNWLNYIIALGIGYLIYKWIIEKDYNIMKKIRHLNISFGTTNFMLVVFIFIMIIWSYV